MRTANPALHKGTFARFEIEEASSVMTLEGTVIKTGILLMLVIASAAVTWIQVVDAVTPVGDPPAVKPTSTTIPGTGTGTCLYLWTRSPVSSVISRKVWPNDSRLPR